MKKFLQSKKMWIAVGILAIVVALGIVIFVLQDGKEGAGKPKEPIKTETQEVENQGGMKEHKSADEGTSNETDKEFTNFSDPGDKPKEPTATEPALPGGNEETPTETPTENPTENPNDGEEKWGILY